METIFSIQLTYEDDVTSELSINNYNDGSATGVTFKDKKVVSMKFPHGSFSSSFYTFTQKIDS